MENRESHASQPQVKKQLMRNVNLGHALTRYTNPNRPSYDSAFNAAVRAQFPHWFEDTAAKNKTTLLAMEPGSPRPVQKKHPLGQLLTGYTNETNDSYDAEFDAAIRVKQPHWFEDTAAKNKADLLAMEPGSPRPHNKNHPLGRVLASYISKSHGSYDAAFEAAIRAKHPGWFEDTAAKNKAALLAMEPESPRPHNKKHPLGSPLCCYTSKNRDTYDAEFTATISARFPHWFEEFSAKKMSDLLALPLDSPRPNKHTHPLGPALVAYTNKPKPGRGSRSIYDPAFDAAIRARFPHWFEDAVARNKADLLALSPDSSRPVERKHPLGKVLNHYITKPKPGSKSSYDPEFDAAIRTKFPNWFEDTAVKNKDKLLSMEPGSPRPAEGKHPLGVALGRYTRKLKPGSKSSYDPEFDIKIRARFPHWFKR
jgi:hypothetical protein